MPEAVNVWNNTTGKRTEPDTELSCISSELLLTVPLETQKFIIWRQWILICTPRRLDWGPSIPTGTEEGVRNFSLRSIEASHCQSHLSEVAAIEQVIIISCSYERRVKQDAYPCERITIVGNLWCWPGDGEMSFVFAESSSLSLLRSHYFMTFCGIIIILRNVKRTD